MVGIGLLFLCLAYAHTAVAVVAHQRHSSPSKKTTIMTCAPPKHSCTCPTVFPVKRRAVRTQTNAAAPIPCRLRLIAANNSCEPSDRRRQARVTDSGVAMSPSPHAQNRSWGAANFRDNFVCSFLCCLKSDLYLNMDSVAALEPSKPVATLTTVDVFHRLPRHLCYLPSHCVLPLPVSHT